ncbi:hypothetical protein [Peptacetobacter hiranonis]|nr:hypothetical protein [Peptacetobacter hiranonis]QEK20660.1 hypothetical protein KGNDJEFE_01143 [Peptacetobacter hiranonis]
MLVHIYSTKIDYEFELDDKITLVSNESWLGEHILIKMISDSYNEPNAVHDESDIRCYYYMKGRYFELEKYLKVDKQNITFIQDFDEIFEYEDFLERIKDSEYYFVLFTRDVKDPSRPIRKMVVDEDKTTKNKIYITLEKPV